MLTGLKPSIRDDGVPFSASKRIGDKARKDKEKESPERVVEEWTYINHDSKIGPATIYFNKTVDNHNVIFLSFEPTPWHGKVTLLENEIMVIRFNCRGDTANLHTAMVRKLGKDLWEGEDDKRRRIQVVFTRKGDFGRDGDRRAVNPDDPGALDPREFCEELAV